MTSLNSRYECAKQALFCRYYEARLNPPQRQAVCKTEGPLLVLAGAGSGKTTVLIRRIVHLVRYGCGYSAETAPTGLDEATVEALENALDLPIPDIESLLPLFIKEPCPPEQILAITFTNKAAKEIKERLSAALGDEEIAKRIWSGTFHSVCLRILRRFPDEAGLSRDFTIYDTDDQKKLISECLKELQIDEDILSPRDALKAISRAKDRLETPEDMELDNNYRAKKLATVYRLYTARLSDCNAVDFDDIIVKTIRLLQSSQSALRFCQRQFRYVLVDEFQDTNPAQLVLTELLASGTNNLMVVGDDDQSIYRFRGATVENILSFNHRFPDAAVIKLEQNYRSTKNILAAANSIIANNEARYDKALWCDAQDGEPISLYRAQTAEDEADFIIRRSIDLVVKEKKQYRDIAVLYRLNELSRSLESSFIKAGLPYRVLGGQRFYDRKEIRDILAYLQLINNKRDNQRLKRIINEPKRQIGQKTVDTIEECARRDGCSMFEVMMQATLYPELARSAPRLIAFVAMIQGLSERNLPPSSLIPAVFEESGYADMLRAEGEIARERIDHVSELVTAAVEYEAHDESPTLAAFLEEVALVADVDKYDESANAVVLMTIHSAKGLEFPAVFIAGAEEGIFPGYRAFDHPDEMSEERRLAYVAVTRAKEFLFVTSASERLLYGRTSYNESSRFFEKEIKPELVRHESSRRRTSLYDRQPPQSNRKPTASMASEWNRTASVSSTAKAAAGHRTAAAYGITAFATGDRVRHAVLGTGTVLQTKEMGGDYLYLIKFDSGAEKRLMATYAKLTAE